MTIGIKITGISIVLALLLFSQAVAGDLYMWTDEQGIRHFSNIAPPPQGQITRLKEQSITLPQGFSCRVIKIYDGDTVRVKGKDIAFKVRLAGIDCPESRWKKMPEQPFAKEAKQALTGWILNKSVILKQHGIGGYNRILAEIFLKGENINLRLVRQGLAEVYRGRLPQTLDIAGFRQAEKEARRNNTGIWSLGRAYISPKKWRKQYQER